ncbi:MAG: hypothetical protein ABI488_17125 [Polyangiaceae bacterium]
MGMVSGGSISFAVGWALSCIVACGGSSRGAGGSATAGAGATGRGAEGGAVDGGASSSDAGAGAGAGAPDVPGGAAGGSGGAGGSPSYGGAPIYLPPSCDVNTVQGGPLCPPQIPTSGDCPQPGLVCTYCVATGTFAGTQPPIELRSYCCASGWGCPGNDFGDAGSGGGAAQ